MSRPVYDNFWHRDLRLEQRKARQPCVAGAQVVDRDAEAPLTQLVDAALDVVDESGQMLFAEMRCRYNGDNFQFTPEESPRKSRPRSSKHMAIGCRTSGSAADSVAWNPSGRRPTSLLPGRMK